MVLFELILFGTLWFLDLDVCFLYHIREVFNYYFFKYIPSPLISSSEAPIMWMLLYMIFSQRSLILFSFLFIYYYFFTFILTFPLLYLPVCWFIPICHLIYCWFLPGYFLFRLLYSSSLFDSFIHFRNLLENFNFSLCLFILLTSLSIFMIIVWTLCQVNFLPPLHFSSFSALSSSFFGSCFPFASFFLILCVYF